MYPVPEWLDKWELLQLPKNTSRLQNKDLFSRLQSNPKSVVVVDIRNEQENGRITLAVHIPATDVEGPADIQEKFLAPALKANPSAELIVIHCNLSAKRASYIAGWAEDHLEKYGPHNVKVQILHGGIVDWLGNDDFASETTRQ